MLPVIFKSIGGAVNDPTDAAGDHVEVMLDLCYEEDARAEVDLNFVMTGGKKIVEVQATAEQRPFDEAVLKRMMDLAKKGIESLVAKQQALLGTLLLRQ